jgi:hypothetical protein
MRATQLVHARAVALMATVVALALASACSDEDTPVGPGSKKTATIAGGTGSGRITSNDAKLDCRVTNGTLSGPSCSAPFDSGAVVTFTATPDADQEFTAWEGECSGTTTCQFSMTRDFTASAKSAPMQRTFALELITPNADDGGLILEISGPNILSITPASGIDVVEQRSIQGANTTITLLMRGNLTAGVVGQMSVRGVSAESPYDVRVLQAAARASGGYAQRSGLGAYTVTVKR